MTAAPHIVVVVRARDPHRQAEGLRAALGLTLRGGTLEVVVHAPLHTPLARRAADTLAGFGHVVHQIADGASDADAEPRIAEALARADRVEVWT